MKPELVFILVEPAREENVGASARAMKTMGFTRLRLVNPQCNHLGERAMATAHASQDILQNARVYQDLMQARDDLSLLIGSAAKRRNVRQDQLPVEELPGLILGKGELVKKIGIAFGGEESGMSNEQLDMCDLLSSIPMYRRYPSLNLGQAVMVFATYLSKIHLNHKRPLRHEATDAELPVIRRKALEILADVDLPADHIIHRRILERLMLLDQDDMNLFHSFCKFYLKKYHNRVK